MKIWDQTVPDHTLQEWQRVVDLIVRIAGARVGLIMRVHTDQIEVFIASNTEKKPYHVGETERLPNSGLYCETVIANQEMVLIPNAMETVKWRNNPDLKHNLLSYLGFPIRLPNGQPFGTICLLDDKENEYSTDVIELMEKMRDLIEQHLKLEEKLFLQQHFTNNSFLQKVLDHIPTPICYGTFIPDFRILYLNAHFMQAFGYTLEDFPVLSEWMTQSDHREQIQNANQDAWRIMMELLQRLDGNAEPGEISITTKDGTSRQVLIRAVVLNDILLASFVDITEQKRTEESLRIGEQRHRLLADNALDTIWTMDLSGRLTYISPSIIKLRGLTPEEFMKLSFADMFTPASCAIVTDGLVRARASVAAGEPVDFRGVEVESIRQDGTVRWSEITATGIYDKYGNFVELLGISRDISARKQAEDALRESEARISAISSSTQDAVLMMNPNGYISFWNPASTRILGYTEQEAVGRDLHQLLAPQRYHEAHRKAFVCYQQTGAGNAINKTLELAAIHKDGHELSIELSLSAIELQDGWHAIGIMRDITDRKQAENALRESETRYRTLIEQSPDGIVTFDAETKQILSANERFAEMVSCSKDQFMEKELRDLVLTDTAESLNTKLESLRQGGSAFWGVQKYAKWDGTFIELERNAVMLVHEGREIVLLTIRDITERRNLEKQLMWDINLAGELQHSLIPPDLTEQLFNVRSLFAPQHIVSGDHLNFVVYSSGKRLNGYLIDVTGHGIATALETAAIRVVLDEYMNSPRELSHEIVVEINQRLTRILTEGHFLAFLGFSFDFVEWKLTIGTYGINTILASTADWQGTKQVPGSYLGISSDIESSIITIPIQPGDKFYFATDGLTDLLADSTLPQLSDFEATCASLRQLAFGQHRWDDCTGIFVNLEGHQ